MSGVSRVYLDASPMPPELLADIILIVHAGFIFFVVGGFLVTLLGAAMGWSWVRNRWFRTIHLGCIVLVVVQQWLRAPCPLTVWANELRHAAGQEGYGDTGFIAYWLHPLIFFDFPRITFDLLYASFGLLVILSFWLAPVRWRKVPAEPTEPTA